MPNHFTNKFIHLGHFSATLQLWFGHCKIDVSFHMLASTMMQNANHGFDPNTQQKSLSFTIMDGKEKLKYWTHSTSSYYFRLSCMSWIGSWRKKSELLVAACSAADSPPHVQKMNWRSLLLHPLTFILLLLTKIALEYSARVKSDEPNSEHMCWNQWLHCLQRFQPRWPWFLSTRLYWLNFWGRFPHSTMLYILWSCFKPLMKSRNEVGSFHLKRNLKIGSGSL